MLIKIISGGQTGVDRAGLDAAIKYGLEHGGSIPRGRRAEDGVLPSIYQLQELTTESYPARTEKNVLDGDATVIISRGRLTGGSRLTCDKAIEYNKPFLHVDLDKLSINEAAEEMLSFVVKYKVGILNVAGPRASGDSEIYLSAFTLLEELFGLLHLQQKRL